MNVAWQSVGTKIAPYIATAIVLAGAVTWYNHVQREIGRRDLLIAQYAATAKTEARRADSLAKVYRIDTLRLWKVQRVTDSLTVTVDRWKHDTLRVVEYVAKADTAIKACVQALGTCEARVGAEKARGDALAKEVGVLKRQIPSAVVPWRDRAVGFGLGVLAGKLIK